MKRETIQMFRKHRNGVVRYTLVADEKEKHFHVESFHFNVISESSQRAATY